MEQVLSEDMNGAVIRRDYLFESIFFDIAKIFNLVVVIHLYFLCQILKKARCNSCFMAGKKRQVISSEKLLPLLFPGKTGIFYGHSSTVE